MANELLDLLGAMLGPTHCHDPRDHSMVSRPQVPERPWASGVPEQSKFERPDPNKEIEALRARVGTLEQLIAVLCETLVASPAFKGPELIARLRKLQDAADAQRVGGELVECANCRAKVARSEVHVRATGALCTACHYGGRREGPEMVEKATGTGGYRDSGVVRVEESVACAGCKNDVPRSKGFLSARGTLCHACHLELEDEGA